MTKRQDTEDTEAPLDALRVSIRGWQILTLIVITGKPNKEIAYELGLTEETVKEYLYRTFQALGLGNRTNAAQWWATRCESQDDLVRRDKL